MIREILFFLYNPQYNFGSGVIKSFKGRMLLFFNLLALCIVSTFSILMLLSLFVEPLVKSELNFSIFDSLTNNRNEFRARNSHWETFIKICLLGPFEEEVLFRLPLITKSLFLRIIIIFGWVDYAFPGFFSLSFFSLWYNIIFFITVGALIIIDFKTNSSAYSLPFGNKNYNYICWGAILVFAGVHINNFVPLNESVFYLYPFYVLPQFIYGVVFSYVAIRYKSFVWPFLLHVAINSTAEIPKLLAYFV